MGTLARKMEQNTKTVGLVMCSVYTDRCHMLKNVFVWEYKITYRMSLGFKSDVSSGQVKEMTWNYVEEN